MVSDLRAWGRELGEGFGNPLMRGAGQHIANTNGSYVDSGGSVYIEVQGLVTCCLSLFSLSRLSLTLSLSRSLALSLSLPSCLDPFTSRYPKTVLVFGFYGFGLEDLG